MQDSGKCLDCGASGGYKYDLLKQAIEFEKSQYHGIEWDADLADSARKRDSNVKQGDLNRKMKFPDETFKCIFGLSVLEHLLMPYHFLRESYRCLENGGTLVILTPNISTFFTVALLLSGKMPSSGPHPD